jgi:inosine/xanthosine triphosphatase
MKLAVGTTNRAKLDAVRDALARLPLGRSDGGESDAHDRHEIVGVATESGVSAQPFSAAETRRGALARAMGALAGAADADFGIGLEGGIEQVPAPAPGGDAEHFVVGWACVVRRGDPGAPGFGSSARLELPPSFLAQLRSGAATELSQVIDRFAADRDLRSSLGVEGLLSGGALLRAECYTHAVVFAFSRFVTPSELWSSA